MGRADIKPVPPVTPPERLGVTRIEKHDQCAYQFYLNLKYGGSAQTAEMTRGSAFHKAVEEATLMAIEQEESQVPWEVVKAIYDGWLEDHPELPISHEEREAGRICAYHWSLHTVLNPHVIYGVEVGLEFVLPRSGVTVISYLDRLDHHGTALEVVDYKTQLNVLSDNDAANHFQLKMYCALAAFGRAPGEDLSPGAGVNEFRGKLVFPRRLTPAAPYREEGIATASASWSRSELQVFLEDVDAAMIAMQQQAESGKWPARAGSHCKYCPAPQECPIPERLRKGHEIRSMADAEAAAEKLFRLEEERKPLQKAIRQHILDTGSPVLFGRDQAYDITETKSRSVKWDHLEHQLVQAVEFGEPFDGTKAFAVKASNRFAVRKQTEDERGR